jgi:ankyrin repeat protein
VEPNQSRVRIFSSQAILTTALAGALLLPPQGFSLLHDPRIEMPADTLPRAVATRNNLLLDLALTGAADLNGRDGEGRTALLIATQQADHALALGLLARGANVDLGDNRGLTPLMVAAGGGDLELLRAFITHSGKLDATDSEGMSAIHYALAKNRRAAVDLLLPVTKNLATPAADERDLLTMACESGDLHIVQAVLERSEGNLAWKAATRSALLNAIKQENETLTRLLLSKHAAPPTAEGTDVPLLAQAVVAGDLETTKALLKAGADPNVTIPAPAPSQFVATLPKGELHDYVRGDREITPLMLAAGLGRTETVRVLLAAGADRNRQTPRYKMLALYFAAHAKKAKCVQLLLGRGPEPEELRVEISLATQRATVFKNGISILHTSVSTGRKGFDTPPGEYVITDKDRTHRSSLYHGEMPFFMRLNCLDFGLHAGVVPNYPASHGCIRLPGEIAERLFTEIPVGTLVTIN